MADNSKTRNIVISAIKKCQFWGVIADDALKGNYQLGTNQGLKFLVL